MLVLAAATFASFSFVFIAWLFLSVRTYELKLKAENATMVVEEKAAELLRTMESVRDQARFYYEILDDQVKREKDVILDALDGRHRGRTVFPLTMPYAQPINLTIMKGSDRAHKEWATIMYHKWYKY